MMAPNIDASATIAPVPGWPTRRATLARPVGIDGRGLNTGKRCRATLKPAPAGQGVIFRCLVGGVAGGLPVET
jgi:hypothetical protein